jgi:hypothetical protein
MFTTKSAITFDCFFGQVKVGLEFDFAAVAGSVKYFFGHNIIKYDFEITLTFIVFQSGQLGLANTFSNV